MAGFGISGHRFLHQKGLSSRATSETIYASDRRPSWAACGDSFRSLAAGGFTSRRFRRSSTQERRHSTWLWTKPLLPKRHSLRTTGKSPRRSADVILTDKPASAYLLTCLLLARHKAYDEKARSRAFPSKPPQNLRPTLPEESATCGRKFRDLL